MKIDVTHSVWPWIADRAGFLRTRFEVGRDGKTANERLKGKSAKVQRRSSGWRTTRKIDVKVGRRVLRHSGHHGGGSS